MATNLEQRELILKEVGSVFGSFQDELKGLHNQYWDLIDKQTSSLQLPPIEKVLGNKFAEFASMYSGFHGYLTVIKRVLEERGDKLDFDQAIPNVRTTCMEWSSHIDQWKKQYGK